MNPPDVFAARARPAFLYVMYAMLLGVFPVGIVAAFSPATAASIATGMAAYLDAIPEPLYALFGTGYLGYTAAREWGKARNDVARPRNAISESAGILRS